MRQSTAASDRSASIRPRVRRLTTGETALARAVFGDAVALERVRLAYAPWRSMAMTLGSVVLFPSAMGGVRDFSAENLAVRAWFVHEMAHVWQFQNRPLWTLQSWIRVLVAGGYGPRRRGYLYPAEPIWGRLNLEQQAEVIADAYRLRCAAPSGAYAGDLDACLRAAGLPRSGQTGLAIAASAGLANR
jgi:hypothetical protein